MLIVYKVMQLSSVWVQIRRILCEACRQPFNYLARGDRLTKVYGLPLLQPDSQLRRALQHELDKAHQRIARGRRAGEACCPHCGRFQSWMITRSRLSGIWNGLWGGGALGLGVAFAATLLQLAPRPPGPLWLGCLLIGAALGAAAGLLTSLPSDAQDDDDPGALPDPVLAELLKECREQGVDPALAWYTALGGELTEKVPVIPLQTVDLTSEA